jgi:hypothetical protein
MVVIVEVEPPQLLDRVKPVLRRRPSGVGLVGIVKRPHSKNTLHHEPFRE